MTEDKPATPEGGSERNLLKRALRLSLPFLIGGAILYWMYRDLDFGTFCDTLGEARWGWLLLSLLPGILAQMLRGVRWQLALRPLGERSKLSHCIWAVFMSYAVSLVIPRMGEVARCGILRRYDGTSFVRSLGTVVTERLVDIGILLLLICVVFIVHLPLIRKIFDLTGVGVTGLTSGFTPTGQWVGLVCLALLIIVLVLCLKRYALSKGFKQVLKGLGEGLGSLRYVNIPLYAACSVATWVCYFLHYALTLPCFSFTAGLGLDVALVSFCVGTIAVIIPTPNGAGPWHFAVTIVLVLYGVGAEEAAVFALVVHLVQTLLLIVLGVVGWLCFLMRKGASEGQPNGKVHR